MIDFDHARTFSFRELRDIMAAGEGTVLVEFWQPRCSSCRATLHTIDELACRVHGHGTVGTFNVQENPEAARSLGVESVPTLLVVQAGEVKSSFQGAETIQTFLERIDEEVFFGDPLDCR